MVIAIAVPCSAQTASRDSAALTTLAKSLAALTGGVSITDVSIQGSAAFIAGTEEDGPAKLEANATASRITLTLGGGTRVEIRNGLKGQWWAPDGSTLAIPLHNNWTPPAWFFPALTIQHAIADASTSVAVDPATGGVALSTAVQGQTLDMTAEIAGLSAAHLEIDGSTFLPSALSFNTHPDDDLSRDIPVRIEFSDYRNVSGALVPFHIRKFLRDTLELDVTVSGVTLNPGLAGSEFEVQ